MNRPILIIVIGYIIGIIWGIYLKISIIPLYFFIFAIYIIIKLPYQKKKFKIFSVKRYFRYIKLIFKINIILTIIVSSFISNIIVNFYNYKYESLYNGVKDINLIAIIISNKKEKEYYDRYKIKILDKKFKNTNLYINVKKDTKLEYGNKIQVKGTFIEPERARNYKGFDYKEYLKTQKVYGTIKVSNIQILETNQGNKISLISNKIFLKIKNNIEKTYSEKMSNIILGIMLGYTDNIDEETRQDFSNSNISHVLAVSGMHISYIIILVSNSTKKVFGKRTSKIISSIVLLIYMFVTNFSISVVRASIMGILTCMSFIVYRKSDTLNNIAISALITLINNPFSITGISFLLTYGGTLGIIYFKNLIEKIIKNIKIRNRKWRYVFLKIQRRYEKIIEVISVSISAQIIIAPIIAKYFNVIGIGFILTNLLLSFIIGPIVILGFIQILISTISINAGNALAKLIEILIYGIVLISKINFGNFKIVTPNLYQIILHYLSIFVFRYLYKIFHARYCNVTQKRVKNTIYALKYKLRPNFKKIKIIMIFVFIFMIIINQIPHNLIIHFIDVGQGDSTLIITPNDKKILIDGGGSETYDVGKNTVIPYLLDRKIKNIDYVIISHCDQDHIGGILSVMKEIFVKNAIISKQFENSENYEMFLQIAKEKNIKIYFVEAGQKINVEKNLYIDVLWPSSDNKITENSLNNNALVCKLVYKEFSMLFTGDIEEIAEKNILKKYALNLNVLKSDILKVAHHGSKSSSSIEFLNAVQSKIAIIGVGKSNKFGHPNDEVLKRLYKYGYKIYRTDENGEVTIKANKKGKIFIDKVIK